MNRMESFNASDVRSVRLRMSWASLEISTQGRDNEIHVLAAGAEGISETLRIDMKDGRLTISQPGTFPFMKQTASWMQVTVCVPEGWKGAVDAACRSGSLSVKQISGSDVRLSTDTGLLQVSDVEGITLMLRSLRGQVDASTLYAEQVALRTMTGSLQLKGCAFRKVKASMLTGSLVMAANAAVESFKAISLTGGVTVYLPQNRVSVLMRSIFGRIAASGIELAAEKETVVMHSLTGHLKVMNNQPQ